MLPDPPRHPIIIIAVAVLVAGGAIAVTWWSPLFGATTVYLMSLVAVTVAASFGGALGGAIASLTAAILLGVLLLPRPNALTITNADDVVRFAIFIGLCAIATIRSARLHATARRLRENESLVRVMIDSAPMLVAATDTTGTIVVFNAECERVSGRIAADVVGQPLIDTFVPPASRADARRRLEDASDDESAQPYRIPWTTADGSERVIEWRSHRLPAASGITTYGFGGDVTERQRIETEMRAAVEAADVARRSAAAAIAARDRFLSTMAHELRGPIIAVSGWARLLATTAVDSNTVRIAERMSRSGVLMQHLIGDVQDLVMLEAGQVTLRPEPVRLDEIASGAVDAAAPVAASRGVTIQCSVDGPVTVLGEADRLQQAATNLLNNALKVTPDGGRIAVSLATAGSCAELVVEDNGPGITDADSQRAFEPFWQSDRTRGTLDLGLPLVQQIARVHGGSARIRRAHPDGGTIASVSLPLVPVAAASPAQSPSEGP